MKHKLSTTLGLIVLLTIALAASRANAQTVANGPYYAWPSWDQKLPAATRFIVLSNWGSAAVLDRETGLVWDKSPVTTTRTWSFALAHCYQREVGGRKGWRLPTIEELASLVDSNAGGAPFLPADHPFTNVQSFIYWSATTSADGASVAWVVNFNNAAVGSVFKSTSHFNWCVRGGQGVDPQ